MGIRSPLYFLYRYRFTSHTLYSFFIHDLVFENDFKEKEKAQQVGCKADSPSDMFNNCEDTYTHHYIEFSFKNILIIIWNMIWAISILIFFSHISASNQNMGKNLILCFLYWFYNMTTELPILSQAYSICSRRLW